MRITRASTKPSKPPDVLYNPRKSSVTPNSLRQSAAKCRFISLACPIALLELIARLGSSQNKILKWHAPLTMNIFYDLRAPNSLRSVLATRSSGKISLACQRQPAVSGMINPKATRLTLPVECIPERFQVCEVGICNQLWVSKLWDDGTTEVKTDV